MSAETYTTTDSTVTTDTSTTDTSTTDKSGGANKPVFTPEQQKLIDSLMGNARNEGRASAYKEAGFNTAEEYTAFLENARQLAKAKEDAENAAKTDLQKAQDEIERLKRERDEKAQLVQTTEQNRRRTLIDTKLETAASKLLAEYPTDVVKYLRHEYAEDVEKLLGDDDKVDEKAVEALVGKVKADRPTWFGSQARGIGSPSNRDGRTPQPGQRELERARRNHMKTYRG